MATNENSAPLSYTSVLKSALLAESEGEKVAVPNGGRVLRGLRKITVLACIVGCVAAGVFVVRSNGTSPFFDKGQHPITLGKEKDRIDVAVIGHVDSGKSTILGHLIYLCGGIDARTIAKFEKESNEVGKGTFKYAWVMDHLKAERERGITITDSMWKLESASRIYTAIDTPGHQDYFKNTIKGIALADAAILVVSSGPGEFEAGFSKQEGLTRKVVLAAQTMGVRQLIVAINKMDAKGADYAENRYKEIKSELCVFLKKAGYNPAKITFVPISGWTGENLIDNEDAYGNSHMGWYKGDTLIQAMDRLKRPKRPTDKNLRVSVSDVYKIQGIGTVVVGRVQTGILKPNTLVKFSNGIEEAEVKSVEMHHESIEEATPGDIVGFNIKNIPRTDFGEQKHHRNIVVGDQKDAVSLRAERFTAQLIVLDVPNQIRAGYTPICFVGTSMFPCQLEKFISKINPRDGEVIENEPTELKSGEVGMVDIIPQSKVCVEKFESFPPLGRGLVMDMKRIVAVFVVKEVTLVAMKTTPKK